MWHLNPFVLIFFWEKMIITIFHVWNNFAKKVSTWTNYFYILNGRLCSHALALPGTDCTSKVTDTMKSQKYRTVNSSMAAQAAWFLLFLERDFYFTVLSLILFSLFIYLSNSFNWSSNRSGKQAESIRVLH